MDDCDHMAWGSRLRQICEGKSEMPLSKVNFYRKQNGLPPLESDQVESVATSTQQPARLRVVKPIALAKPRACCGGGKKPKTPKATALPKRKSILDRAAAYAAAIRRHLADDNATTAVDDMLFRKSQCESCPFNVDQRCTLCDCPLQKNILNNGKLAWRSESCPVGRWHRQNNTQRKLTEPTRNMLFHIFPKLGAEWNWHWHCEQIRQHADLFNGRIVIGIVTDKSTATADEVKAQLQGVPVTDWVIKPNKVHTAETETFVEMLSLVNTDDPNIVTFRGHTKGVTHLQAGVEQPWARLMWQTCMDWPSVADALASHIIAGPMKCHEPLVKKTVESWFYAGTFFWFRSDVFQRDWSTFEPTRWWPEYWPGQVATNKESACLCHDFAVSSVLSAQYWKEHVEPDWQNWKKARGIDE